MIDKTLSNRLLKGSAAQSLNLAARIGEQLLLVPIFLSAWSVELYGEWLLISAIPVYFALSDMGFVTSGSNELARRAQDGISADTRQFFTDYVSVFANWSLIIVAIVTALSFLVPFDSAFNLVVMSGQDAQMAFVALLAGTLVSQNTQTLLGGMRAARAFPLGLTTMALASFIRIAVVYLSLTFFDVGPVGVAVVMLCTRLGTIVFMAWNLRSRDLSPRWRLFQRPQNRIWPLVKTGIEFMLFPASNAMLLQGTLILIGAALGPVFVAVFATHRTLTRFAAKIVQMGVTPLRAEFGLINVETDPETARNLLKRGTALTLWASMIVSIGLLIIGKILFEFWTAGKIAFDGSLFACLLVAVALQGTWRMSATLRLGTNRHQVLARGYLAITLVGMALLYLALQTIGPLGAALVLVAVEGTMMLWVVYNNASLVDLPSAAFFRHLARPPVQDMRLIVNRILRKLRR